MRRDVERGPRRILQRHLRLVRAGERRPRTRLLPLPGNPGSSPAAPAASAALPGVWQHLPV
ncbi:MAG: hypothetical protein M3P53_09920, partial [Actinomycetota bacterium]|nr:hypothetical protein [Actinomycetota bacterium]